MPKLLNRIVLIAALTMLSACASTFRSDVTTFISEPVPTAGKVAVIPMDEKKRDSLEYRDYAAIIGSKLATLGYTQAGNDKPDLIVGFDVLINDGREKIETRPTAHASFYWTSGWYWGRFWGPYPADPFWHDTDLVARTVYNVMLKMEVRKPNGDLIYEGRAESEVRSRVLPELVPKLAEALFKDFPGENGKTKRVVIDLDKKK
ncbi:DUF4136 domain-containing protein [Kordiimonas marina]|uniref:DUF4136 domain-containing protein n=1 Tax=Kordiimonas marina TaxID=2872312 RepID=UPI001FF39E2F|nr:DUF4136 domain-containing protein [Kordiimonas marina]MCJ9429918.1 DUF4136 domain-containing protein [Kordiimonas marina]